MNARIVNMLEAIKGGTYIIYTDYLENTDIDAICQWFHPIISGDRYEIEKVISLNEEYMQIVSYLSTQYNFNKDDFLDLYSAFRKLVFGG